MGWDARIYLDHAASAPLQPAVRQALHDWLDRQGGNPSSVHGPGQAARAQVDAARRQVALALGAKPREVVLTSGATEANALALRGTLAQPLAAWRAGAAAQPQLAVFALEHPSVLAVAEALQAEGVALTRLPSESDGRLNPAALRAFLGGDGPQAAPPGRTPAAVVVAIQAVNHELGALQPLDDIGQLCRSHGALWHCDATQALGKLALLPHALGCNSLALSGHKLGAPAGIGALWLRQPATLVAQLPGHQEGGKRAGTENVLGAVGLHAALRQLQQRQAVMQQVRALRDRLWSQLADLPHVQRNGPLDPKHESGHILSLSFAGLSGAELVLALDVDGLAVSAGSACASGTQAPSAVLLALGDGTPAAAERARGGLRLSLGPETTRAEIEEAARLIRHHATAALQGR